MKKTLILVSMAFLVVACQKFYPPQPQTSISTYNEDESHEKGNNCMSCHYSAGYAEGFFTLAGSMYGNTNQADVELYENIDEPPIMTVQIDRLGNAYTTEPIDFTHGLYVAVKLSNGEREWMEDKIFNGSCNLCHGTSIEEQVDLD